MDALAERLPQIQIVSHSFRDIEVVTRNPLVNQLIESLIQFIFAEVLRGVFQRIFQLLSRQLQRHQSVLVFVEAGDVAHSHRAFGNARLRIEARGHRNVRVAGFKLHALNEINDGRVVKATIARR